MVDLNSLGGILLPSSYRGSLLLHSAHPWIVPTARTSTTGRVVANEEGMIGAFRGVVP